MWLRNRSHQIIKKNYIHIQVTIPPIPCLGPTTSKINYTPEYFLHLCTSHRWAVRKCVPQWWPVTTECTTWWEISLLSTGGLKLGDINTFHSYYSELYSPQSVWPTNGGRPPSLLTLLLSPPIYSYHRVILYIPLPYRASPAPVTFIPYSSTHLKPPPTNAMIYVGSITGPPSCCCWMQLCAPSTGRPQNIPRDPRSHWYSPDWLQKNYAESPNISIDNPQAGTCLTHNTDYWGSTAGPVSHTSHIWGNGWDVSPGYIGYPPQCCRLKWLLRPFQVQDDPGHPGKGQGSNLFSSVVWN